jgi:hypothetical protein
LTEIDFCNLYFLLYDILLYNSPNGKNGGYYKKYEQKMMDGRVIEVKDD